MPSDETIELIVKLLNRLKKSDLTPLIWLVVCAYLYGYLAPILTSMPNTSPYPFNLILTVIPLVSFLLAIVFIIFKFISANLKNKDTEEEDDMTIIKLGTFDQKNLDNLINQFDSSHIQAKRLSARMRLWKSGGNLEMQDKLDLMKWCKIADDNRKKAREIARKISMLVFGKDISKK